MPPQNKKQKQLVSQQHTKGLLATLRVFGGSAVFSDNDDLPLAAPVSIVLKLWQRFGIKPFQGLLTLGLLHRDKHIRVVTSNQQANSKGEPATWPLIAALVELLGAPRRTMIPRTVRLRGADDDEVDALLATTAGGEATGESGEEGGDDVNDPFAGFEENGEVDDEGDVPAFTESFAFGGGDGFGDDSLEGTFVQQGANPASDLLRRYRLKLEILSENMGGVPEYMIIFPDDEQAAPPGSDGPKAPTDEGAKTASPATTPAMTPATSPQPTDLPGSKSTTPTPQTVSPQPGSITPQQGQSTKEAPLEGTAAAMEDLDLAQTLAFEELDLTNIFIVMTTAQRDAMLEQNEALAAVQSTLAWEEVETVQTTMPSAGSTPQQALVQPPRQPVTGDMSVEGLGQAGEGSALLAGLDIGSSVEMERLKFELLSTQHVEVYQTHSYITSLTDERLHAEVVQIYEEKLARRGDYATGPRDGYYFRYMETHLLGSGLQREFVTLHWRLSFLLASNVELWKGFPSGLVFDSRFGELFTKVTAAEAGEMGQQDGALDLGAAPESSAGGRTSRAEIETVSGSTADNSDASPAPVNPFGTTIMIGEGPSSEQSDSENDGPGGKKKKSDAEDMFSFFTNRSSIVNYAMKHGSHKGRQSSRDRLTSTKSQSRLGSSRRRSTAALGPDELQSVEEDPMMTAATASAVSREFKRAASIRKKGGAMFLADDDDDMSDVGSILGSTIGGLNNTLGGTLNELTGTLNMLGNTLSSLLDTTQTSMNFWERSSEGGLGGLGSTRRSMGGTLTSTSAQGDDPHNKTGTERGALFHPPSAEYQFYCLICVAITLIPDFDAAVDGASSFYPHSRTCLLLLERCLPDMRGCRDALSAFVDRAVGRCISEMPYISAGASRLALRMLEMMNQTRKSPHVSEIETTDEEKRHVEASLMRLHLEILRKGDPTCPRLNAIRRGVAALLRAGHDVLVDAVEVQRAVERRVLVYSAGKDVTETIEAGYRTCSMFEYAGRGESDDLSCEFKLQPQAASLCHAGRHAGQRCLAQRLAGRPCVSTDGATPGTEPWSASDAVCEDVLRLIWVDARHRDPRDTDLVTPVARLVHQVRPRAIADTTFWSDKVEAILPPTVRGAILRYASRQSRKRDMKRFDGDVLDSSGSDLDVTIGTQTMIRLNAMELDTLHAKYMLVCPPAGAASGAAADGPLGGDQRPTFREIAEELSLLAYIQDPTSEERVVHDELLATTLLVAGEADMVSEIRALPLNHILWRRHVDRVSAIAESPTTSFVRTEAMRVLCSSDTWMAALPALLSRHLLQGAHVVKLMDALRTIRDMNAKDNNRGACLAQLPPVVVSFDVIHRLCRAVTSGAKLSTATAKAVARRTLDFVLPELERTVLTSDFLIPEALLRAMCDFIGNPLVGVTADGEHQSSSSTGSLTAITQANVFNAIRILHVMLRDGQFLALSGSEKTMPVFSWLSEYPSSKLAALLSGFVTIITRFAPEQDDATMLAALRESVRSLEDLCAFHTDSRSASRSVQFSVNGIRPSVTPGESVWVASFMRPLVRHITPLLMNESLYGPLPTVEKRPQPPPTTLRPRPPPGIGSNLTSHRDSLEDSWIGSSAAPSPTSWVPEANDVKWEVLHYFPSSEGMLMSVDTGTAMTSLQASLKGEPRGRALMCRMVEVAMELRQRGEIGENSRAYRRIQGFLNRLQSGVETSVATFAVMKEHAARQQQLAVSNDETIYQARYRCLRYAMDILPKQNLSKHSLTESMVATVIKAAFVDTHHPSCSVAAKKYLQAITGVSVPGT